jgi:sec-independent protein translocase protein TatA
MVGILVLIALLLFGAPRLPGIARSVGQSMRIFKSEVKELKQETAIYSSEAPQKPAEAFSNATSAATKTP